jgi:hypothetical protein
MANIGSEGASSLARAVRAIDGLTVIADTPGLGGSLLDAAQF